MTPLRRRLDEYLALRRKLGFKLERAGHLLPDFVRFLEARRVSVITMALALEWAKQPPHGHPGWWAERLGLVRSFAEHIVVLDPRTEVPPPELLPAVTRRASPYLYSDDEIGRLIAAARTRHSPLRGETYATMIGLLAVSGMRIGEVIALDRDDVDLAAGILVVRFGKFRRSREIPLHQTTVRALRDYARLRDRCVPRPRSPSFLLSSKGTRLFYKNAHYVFHELVRSEIVPGSGQARPRVHDLRHTFAVRTLVGWYRNGADVDALMPRLSTYLGHVAPSSTYWYLSASPELFALAARRLDRVQRRVP
jgi:integrase/recombinase XerD